MCVTMTPISSMCPANITRGRPAPLSVANEFPATSPRTSSAKRCASVRQSRAGAASNADGPGVSSSDLRKASDSGVMVIGWKSDKGRGHDPTCLPLGATQGQLEKLGAGNWVVPVRGDGPEAETLIQAARLGHPGESVQAHRAVASRAGFVDRRARQTSAQSGAPKPWPDIQAFHFAHIALERPDPNASCRSTPDSPEQQAPCGWRVGAG